MTARPPDPDAQHRVFVVDLAIGADEFVRLYRGTARDVVAQSHSGVTVRFPANALRRFVLRDGVYGTFRLVVDGDNKLISIDRVTN